MVQTRSQSNLSDGIAGLDHGDEIASKAQETPSRASTRRAAAARTPLPAALDTIEEGRPLRTGRKGATAAAAAATPAVAGRAAASAAASTPAAAEETPAGRRATRGGAAAGKTPATGAAAAAPAETPATARRTRKVAAAAPAEEEAPPSAAPASARTRAARGGATKARAVAAAIEESAAEEEAAPHTAVVAPAAPGTAERRRGGRGAKAAPPAAEPRHEAAEAEEEEEAPELDMDDLARRMAEAMNQALDKALAARQGGAGAGTGAAQGPSYSSSDVQSDSDRSDSEDEEEEGGAAAAGKDGKGAAAADAGPQRRKFAPSLATLPQPLRLADVAPALAAAADKPRGLNKSLMAPPKHTLAKEAKKAKPDTAGKAWYNLPAQQIDQQMKTDLRILRLRGAFDPKRHYKSFDNTKFPKHFQVGTVVEGPTEYHTDRLVKRDRKRTLAEEILHDTDLGAYRKRKYSSMQAEASRWTHKRPKKTGKGERVNKKPKRPQH